MRIHHAFGKWWDLDHILAIDDPDRQDLDWDMVVRVHVMFKEEPLYITFKQIDFRSSAEVDTFIKDVSAFVDEWGNAGRTKTLAETVCRLLEADPHQWSKRPCPTCRAVSALLGVSFGCFALATKP